MHNRSFSRLAVLATAPTLSACSATPYLAAGVMAEDVRYFEFNTESGAIVAAPRNPIARATVGYEFEPAPAWRVSVDVSHSSSLRTGDDRGVNAATVSVRWYPFSF